MAGLLTHLSIALIGFIIGTLIFKNYKYGLAFAIGHLIPDLLDFGIAGIKQGSLNPGVIMTNPLFHPLAVFGHTFSNWIIIAFVIIIILFVFYGLKKISKEKVIMLDVLIIIFLTGVAVHLIIDALIIETSYWI